MYTGKAILVKIGNNCVGVKAMKPQELYYGTFIILLPKI